jgi:methionyl-tRNA formyltransferase
MRIVFIGTGEIGVPVLRSLLQSDEHELVGIVTQPDKPAGRAQRIEAPPVKEALAGSGLPIFQPARIKSEEAVANIRGLAPDVIVVMAYGQILPRSVLEIPRVACLNLHASLLPRHRGAAPIQAAIVAGDRESGITVMYMDEGLDTGDILLQSRLEIAAGETGGSLHDRLGQIAPEALGDALTSLASGNAPRNPQDSSLATYAPKLEREQGRIDWTESAALIERKIRAFNPWPGAFALLRDEAGRERKLKIFSTTVVESETATPGEVLGTDKSKLLIAANDGALALGEVQLEGKRRMSASEFLRGHSAPMRIA